MKKCLICNNELHIFKNKYICLNCNKVFDINEIDESTWYEMLVDTYREWNYVNSDKIPYIIKKEYLRIFELLENNQVYGAFFQIKDTFEIILKVSVLNVISEIISNEDIDEINKDIIFKLFEKPLCLGDWQTIGKLLEGKSNSKEQNDILENIITIYEKKSITKWRNDYIGHGALGIEEERNFIEEVSSKIELINNHLKKFKEQYTKLNYLSLDNKIILEICGNKKVELYPFFIIENNEIYLFDSYKSNKRKSVFLNYSRGTKLECKINDINEFVERLQFENNSRVFTSSVNEGVYLVAEDEILKEISKVNDYVRPDYVIDEIQDFILTERKGSFLIRMERGMGKSTLASALDSHGLNKIKLGNSIVRTYYINDTYGSRIEGFISTINDLFRIDKQGKLVYKGNLPYLNSSSLNYKADFSKMLSSYYELFLKRENSDKLVLIIDGLDEIVDQENGSIFDFIPNKEEIEENVYIICTARTDKELKNCYFVQNNINKIGFTRILNISKENGDYSKLLSKYLVKKYKNISDELIKTLIKKSNNSFRYLKNICNVLDREDILIHDLPQDEGFYEYSLKNLKRMFGEKYYNKILEILLILSQSDEALTLSQISYLIYQEPINFKIISYIYHLKELLRIDRTRKGNRFQLIDLEFSIYIKKENSCELNLISNMLIEETLKSMNDEIVKLNDLNIYVYSNLKTLIDSSKYTINTFLSERMIDNLMRIDEKFSRKDLNSLWSLYRIQNQILYILNQCKKDNQKYNIYTGIISSNQGEVYDLIGFTKEAYELFKSSIKILDSNCVNDDSFVLYLSSITYIKYALLCVKIGENEKAIHALNRVLHIYSILEKKQKLRVTPKDYLYVYNNRGIAYQNLNKIVDAEIDYNNAINIISKDNIDLDEELSLMISKIYLNRGVILSMKGKKYYEEVLKDYENALNYVNNNSDAIKEQKAIILLNKGKTLIEIENIKEGDKYTREAIYLLEELKEKELLIDDEILMKAYINNGIILKKTDRIKQAIGFYDKAISIVLRLKEEGKFYNEYELCRTYYLLSLVYEKNKQSGLQAKLYLEILKTYEFKRQDAFNLYLTAINNYLSINTSEKSINKVKFYINKMKIIVDKKIFKFTEKNKNLINVIFGIVINHCKSIGKYTITIDFITTYLLLLEEDKKENLELIGLMIKEKGYCYVKNNEAEKGLYVYNKSISILEELYKDAKLEKIDELAMIYFNRAMIYLSKRYYQNSFDDAYLAMVYSNECTEHNIQISYDLIKKITSYIMWLYSKSDQFNINVC